MNYIKTINTLFVKSWVGLVLLSAMLLSGCNGHSEEDNTNRVIGDNIQADISVSDINGNATNSITVGNQVTVSVTLSATNGEPIANQNVSFVATDGTLSAASRLTNGQGTTSVSFDSSSVNPGVVTITASTTYNDESITADIDFEVLATAVTNIETPSLEITLKKDGNAVNRIKADESAQLGVILTDANDQPIENSIVTFSAEIGQLSATTALTNANGIAEVSLTGQEDNLGAAVATASVSINENNIVKTTPYEVVASDALDESTTVLIGHFDADGNFVDGEIGVESSTHSAGATIGLEVVLVNQNLERITTPTTVNFASSCVNTGDASIDASVVTNNGVAESTYQDLSCAGADGTTDTIVATVVVNSADLSATTDITLSSESLGSVEFISATPESIVLKGTGGQGKQETSTVTFVVKGELGNPLNQQAVDFSLNTDVGGLSLAAASGITNSEGLVSAKVVAGTVPTAVRVTATVTVDDQGNTISTQSDLLSVNTGLPDQNSITLALSTINPEARNIIGTNVDVTAYLADSFNNPVPDGTTVNFTTEGGAIEPSCTTTDGNCTVTWTSQEPFTDNHRVTILATAEGHEYFVDVNGNNLFDDNDGGAVNGTTGNIDEILSGFGRVRPFDGGYIDMPEAWRDDNENFVYDVGEVFIDSNNNGTRDVENDLFNGPQCEATSCATSNFITIRKAVRLITSSSKAYIRILDASDNVVYQNYGTTVRNNISIARGSSQSFTLEVSDTQFQTMAHETGIALTSDVGDSVGTGTFTIGNTAGSDDPAVPGTFRRSFTLINNLTVDDEPQTGGLEFSVVSPSTIETSDGLVINLL